jgi:hypothetical protein
MEKIEYFTDDEIDKLGCDVWHVFGYNGMNYKNGHIDKFIQRIKTQLPYVELPIDIGGTGYPKLRCNASECPKRGWCIDNAKRLNAIIDGYLIFQRYTTGGPMMFGKLPEPASNIMDAETMEKFSNKL